MRGGADFGKRAYGPDVGGRLPRRPCVNQTEEMEDCIMTCRNCGQEIHEGSVFCPHCGAAQAPSPESPWNAASGSAPAWEGPEGGEKKK